MTLTKYVSERILRPTSFGLADAAYLRVAKLDEELKKLPSVDCPITHHFARQAKMYAREMFIPKGTVLTSRVHKFESISFLLKGEMSVLTNDGVKHIKAPYTLVSPAGTQRAGYAHEDSIWTCVFQTEEQDIDKIEDELGTKTYQEYLEYTEQLCLLG